MKLKLGQVFKKAMPFVRTGATLVKVGKNVSKGDYKSGFKNLKSIQKRGDLKKMIGTVKEVNKERKANKKRKTESSIDNRDSHKQVRFDTDKHIRDSIDARHPVNDIFYDPIDPFEGVSYNISNSNNKKKNVTNSSVYRDDDGDEFYDF